MDLAARLRRLDRRVLGEPKRDRSATQQRRVFLVGLVGTVAVVVLALVLRQPLILASSGGFVGMMIGGGIRWGTAAATPSESRFLRPLLGAGVLAVVALVAAFVTSGRWNHERGSDVIPGPYFQRVEPTMVVLCAETRTGRAYTYQAPAAESPTCRNGAEPKVVVRG